MHHDPVRSAAAAYRKDSASDNEPETALARHSRNAATNMQNQPPPRYSKSRGASKKHSRLEHIIPGIFALKVSPHAICSNIQS